MEEKKLSEQESLELISQMIRSTRKNMEVGSGNQFLYWGYFTAALSVLLFLLVYYTGDARWSIGWPSVFILEQKLRLIRRMFLFWGFMLRMQRKETPSVITYTDRAILQVWKVIGSLFVLTVVIMSLLAFHYGGVNFSLMLPLSLLYSGIGVSITGIIIRSRVVMWSPLVGFCFAIYMLMAYTLHQAVTIDWYLYFGLSFVVMMVLPGHYLNRKARNVC